ncbi:hypothetical protein BJ508DRAFT_222936 [Ascobolus immersus RN42]|uniref:U1-type domain-containing protein n=1 Tax=Ascobolus immersus RN42 TaxID=1160509 RepID=A0A3N4IIV8_ASCIM|nr:hypothetical protein BJ508DRAFT_222936 [Ascobolus immersus RN42]
MTDKSNVYGSAGDTTHRKTWDRAEFAAKAEERTAREKAEAKARYEAKAAGKKYHRQQTPPSQKSGTRERKLNLEENLNKTTIVPAGAGIGKRGKGAGFYCDVCDLTYKDSLQWVDHLNSKQHLFAVGESGEVEVATLEDVKERFTMLVDRRDREMKEGDWDLKRRLEERKKLDEEERRIKREKRKEKKRKEREEKEKAEKMVGVVTEGDGKGDGEEEDEEMKMMRMMGFGGGFGSTKKKN